MKLELYVHFPFCKQKCLYCDFCSAPGSRSMMEAYCEALCREISLSGKEFQNSQITTVFFGGGTPSMIPPEMMACVLSALHDSFQILPNVEFTSEANPGTLTDEWIEAMCKGGINRLSLGMQASQLELLARIGRIHTHRQTIEAVGMARKHGITNLNLDLMMALPGQTHAEWAETLNEAFSLAPEHISAYSLILEEGTPLHRMVQEGKLTLPSEDDAADMYEEGLHLLRKNGYHRYEISNFARDGYACKHNLGYWQDSWYLGLGVAAHSMLPPRSEQRVQGAFHVRRSNTTDTAAYIQAMQENPNQRIENIDLVSKEEAMRESLMLRLRTSCGICFRTFESVHGVPFPSEWEMIARQLEAEGLVHFLQDGFALTDRGMEVQNAVLLRFFS